MDPAPDFDHIQSDTPLEQLPVLEPREPSPPRGPPTRVGRRARLPKRYTDFLPTSATPLPQIPKPPRRIPAPCIPSPECSPAAEPEVPPPIVIQTEPNEFGLYRIYPFQPSADPEEIVSLEDVCDASTLATPENVAAGGSNSAISSQVSSLFNATVARLLTWFYGSSITKSINDLDRLVHDVLLQDDFDIAHLKDFSAKREIARLDKPSSPFDGWKESSVKIRLPCERVKHTSEANAPEFEVKGLYHRNMTDIIVSAFQQESARDFHMNPFEQWWKPTFDEPPQRVWGELYTSDAWLDADKELRARLPEPGCKLPTAIAAIMLWSDSTHLANFGTASLWPLYISFGNQSKYVRGKPTSSACHHLAYFPSVSFQLNFFFPTHI